MVSLDIYNLYFEWPCMTVKYETKYNLCCIDKMNNYINHIFTCSKYVKRFQLSQLIFAANGGQHNKLADVNSLPTLFWRKYVDSGHHNMWRLFLCLVCGLFIHGLLAQSQVHKEIVFLFWCGTTWLPCTYWPQQTWTPFNTFWMNRKIHSNIIHVCLHWWTKTCQCLWFWN